MNSENWLERTGVSASTPRHRGERLRSGGASGSSPICALAAEM